MFRIEIALFEIKQEINLGISFQKRSKPVTRPKKSALIHSQSNLVNLDPDWSSLGVIVRGVPEEICWEQKLALNSEQLINLTNNLESL